MLVIPMLNCFTSALRDLKKPAVPNLAAEYMVLKPVPIIPAMDMMFTILDLCYLTRRGRKPFVMAMWDMQFVFIIILQVSNSVLTNSSLMVIPALLITTST